MTYHRYAIRILLTLAAVLVALTILIAGDHRADAMIPDPPPIAKVMRTLPKVPRTPADQHCTEDEFGYWVRADLVICVHIEGDGWRPVEVAI